LTGKKEIYMASLCGKCGVPKSLSRFNTWKDGCITDNSGKAASLFAYEVSSANAFIEEVGLLLDIPIDGLVFNSACYDSEQLVRNLLESRPLLSRLASKSPFSRLIYHLVADFGKASGIGNVELLEIRGNAGDMDIKLRVTNPFNYSFVSAVIVGASKAMYGYPVTHSKIEDGNGSIMQIKQIKEEQPVDFRHRASSAGLPPRELCMGEVLPACKRCGAPERAGSEFSWDLQRGIITESTSNERIFFPGLYLVNSMISEFEKILGYPVTDTFIKVERKLFGRKLARTLMGWQLWDESELRDYLALRGLGMLRELEMEGEKAKITVDNAFMSPILAGRLITLWEYRFNHEPGYNLAIDNNVAYLTIFPLDDDY
jgi:hypothetical protein